MWRWRREWRLGFFLAAGPGCCALVWSSSSPRFFFRDPRSARSVWPVLQGSGRGLLAAPGKPLESYSQLVLHPSPVTGLRSRLRGSAVPRVLPGAKAVPSFSAQIRSSLCRPTGRAPAGPYLGFAAMRLSTSYFSRSRPRPAPCFFSAPVRFSVAFHFSAADKFSSSHF
jgi:hypothetical protein